jgi:arsenate reductase
MMMTDNIEQKQDKQTVRRVLFLCTGNAARSQMAEAFLRTIYGNTYESFSAGVEPKGIHRLTLKVMLEAGVPMSGHRSKSLDEILKYQFDVVVTLCDHAREVCPFHPGAHAVEHQAFPDPASVTGTEEEKIETFRSVRDEIERWIRRRFGGNE